jgi:phosphohistidine phosphatase
MDRLILLRHGKAEPDSVSGDDFDRRLAPRGVRVSTAARARGTWEAASVAFPNTRPSFEAHLYHADSATIRDAARGALANCATVMIVGHNPGLQELTVQLLREGSAPAGLIAKAQRDFPTACAAVFLFDDNGRPQFDGLFIPER